MAMDRFTFDKIRFESDYFISSANKDRTEENIYESYTDLSRAFELFKGLFYITGSIAFFLNLGLFCILLQHRRLSKFQLPLLTSLSFTDLITAGLSVFYYDVCFFSIWQGLDECFRGSFLTDKLLQEILKLLLGLIYSVSQWAGLFALYAVTLDMLIAVFKPLYYRRCKFRHRGPLIVLAIWVLSIFLLSADFFLNFVFGGGRQIIFVSFSSLSLLPFLIMYSAITCKIWYHVKKSPTNKARSMKKSLVTILLIVGTYCICSVPFVWIYFVLFGLQTELKVEIYIKKSFHLLYIINTVLDPIICVLRLSMVRKTLRRLLSFKRKQSQNSQHTTQQTSVYVTCIRGK